MLVPPFVLLVKCFDWETFQKPFVYFLYNFIYPGFIKNDYIFCGPMRFNVAAYFFLQFLKKQI